MRDLATNSLKSHFVPIPRVGGDVACGLSRSTWIKLEKLGKIRLVRVQTGAGKKHRVLLPVWEAVQLLYSMATASPGAKQQPRK